MAQAGAAAEQAIREGVARLQVQPSLLLHSVSFCCWFRLLVHDIAACPARCPSCCCGMTTFPRIPGCAPRNPRAPPSPLVLSGHAASLTPY